MLCVYGAGRGYRASIAHTPIERIDAAYDFYEIIFALQKDAISNVAVYGLLASWKVGERGNGAHEESQSPRSHQREPNPAKRSELVVFVSKREGRRAGRGQARPAEYREEYPVVVSIDFIVVRLHAGHVAPFKIRALEAGQDLRQLNQLTVARPIDAEPFDGLLAHGEHVE